MPLSAMEETIVVENAAAIRARVSELVGGGMSLQAAKAAALKGYAMGGVPEPLRPHVAWLVENMPAADLHPDDARASASRIYAGGVESGAVTDSALNRALWRLLGLTL